MKLSAEICLLAGGLLSIVDSVEARGFNQSISQWLYTSEINDKAISLLKRPEIHGIQSLYTWKSLEPAQDQYDFSAIANDLNKTKSHGKHLWVQIQDRSFDIAYNPVPKYLQVEFYNNGSVPQCDSNDCDKHFVAGGWATAQWNPHVRERFQRLLKKLAASFDGKVYGFNLAETAIEIQANNDTGYTCQGYFEGTLDNARYAASIFNQSYVVQYVNFWPCGWANEHNYLSDSFQFFADNGVGLGGPDNIPHSPNMEINAYRYMSRYRDKVPISVIAVQEPDLAANNTKTGKPFTKDEFLSFAEKDLGSNILFWALSAPWLQQ
ncbi:uncharacterized protein N7529_004195 [Penicillium soppii]|jgi:hypothetical protein|uniref:uncharacterized protein n=1 Tax=Penicillium soppii TaxID=69789 RepID=UPI002546D9CF|nr:uncharacterized protein N7529_004195 [Penicillium soppii]KAJ5871842.1 hypothetical protein N7529_004195 [Penicillium soppii]